MREITRKSFKKLEGNLKSNKQSYRIEAKRGQRYLFHNGRMVAKVRYKTSVETKIDNKKDQQRVLSLIANVKKSFSRFIKNNEVVELLQEYGSVYTNRIAFSEHPEDEPLYYVDLKHCYWRIAYLLGYISERIYETNLEKPEMKLYRNMALSCTIAPKIVEIHEYSKPLLIEQEDTSKHQIMYSNIRYYAWNLMGSIVHDHIGREKVFGYWTDGILVGKEDSEAVKKIFDNNNLLYRVKDCVKVDARHYKENERDRIKRI